MTTVLNPGCQRAAPTQSERKILLAITGASGSLYGELLLRFLLESESCGRVYLVMSETGRQVAQFELKASPALGSLVRIMRQDFLEKEQQKLCVFKDTDMFAPIASGTSAPDSMIILPCSMGTLARVVSGMSHSLIERAADVMLKQRRNFVLCPRESPLSQIHLENLLTLAKMGVAIVPLMTAMYQKPKTVQDVVLSSVGRVCEMVGLEHEFYAPWNSNRT